MTAAHLFSKAIDDFWGVYGFAEISPIACGIVCRFFSTADLCPLRKHLAGFVDLDTDPLAMSCVCREVSGMTAGVQIHRPTVPDEQVRNDVRVPSAPIVAVRPQNAPCRNASTSSAVMILSARRSWPRRSVNSAAERVIWKLPAQQREARDRDRQSSRSDVQGQSTAEPGRP